MWYFHLLRTHHPNSGQFPDLPWPLNADLLLWDQQVVRTKGRRQKEPSLRQSHGPNSWYCLLAWWRGICSTPRVCNRNPCGQMQACKSSDSLDESCFISLDTHSSSFSHPGIGWLSWFTVGGFSLPNYSLESPTPSGFYSSWFGVLGLNDLDLFYVETIVLITERPP